jgi:sulfoxide reductase heme-binding subunit YedZ
MSMRLAKSAVFVLCTCPLLYLIWRAVEGELSANPIEDITHETGRWILKFLFITLAISPIRKTTGWNSLIRFRRMTGLFAFFYGTLHFLTYLVFYQFFNWPEIYKDVIARPFITVGFAALVMMLPLAVTSTKGWIVRLGGKRWQQLHRLIYASATAGVIHYWWGVKLDKYWPLIYATVLAVLLGFRILQRFQRVKLPRPAVQQ